MLRGFWLFWDFLRVLGEVVKSLGVQWIVQSFLEIWRL